MSAKWFFAASSAFGSFQILVRKQFEPCLVKQILRQTEPKVGTGDKGWISKLN